MAEIRSIPPTSIIFRRSPTVLVGREQEQVFLREELAAARSGQGRLVLLGGEAGIGKTALARDLVQEARTRGVCVLAGHCYDLTNTPPYGPWLEFIAEAPAGSGMPAPPAAFAGGVLARVTDQAALFAEVRRYLSELSAGQPLLVLLEDLHWADPASLELLRHIAPHLWRWRVFLVATYRVDELTRRHPFAQQLPALVREAEGLRLDLRRLDREALSQLAATRYRLTTGDEARLVGYIERHAEGNPFFTTELLRALEEQELLWEGVAGWMLEPLDRVLVPSLLRQVIDGRVDRLGDDVREPLAIAAVIGQDVPLPLWAAVARLDDEVLLAIVDRAVDAHLLEADQDGARVRFVHALTREALYEGVLPPRRRLWHQQVAQILIAGANPDPDAVAYHLQQGGDPHAWEWLVLAGDRAQRAYAWRTAAERLHAAADLLATIPEQEQQRAQLLGRLGRLLRFSHPADALNHLDEAERLSARLEDPILMADISFHRGVLLGYLDQFQSGIARVVSASEAFEAMPLAATRSFVSTGAWLADVLMESPPDETPDAAQAAELLHTAGIHFRRTVHPWFLASSGQSAAAVAIGEHYMASLARAAQTSAGVRFSTAFAYHGFGIAYAALGRAEEARQAWVQAREIFAEHAHHALIAFTLLDELRDVALTFDAANPTVRRRVAADAEAALGRAGGALRTGVSPRLVWLGCLVLDGRWDEADRILSTIPDPGNAVLRREVRVARATLARYRGEPAAAWDQITPLFPEGSDTAPGDLIHQEGQCLQRLAADLCMEANDPATARVWLEAHDRWLAWSGHVLGQADGTLAWARFHLANGDCDRARASANQALALAAAPNQPLARLAAQRLLSQIETVAGRFEDAQTRLTAALDLADACETPLERALTQLAATELHLATGVGDEARIALDEVRLICTPLRAAPLLARADALAALLALPAAGESFPAGLTQREVEVLRLVAQRQTDKEIADALFLGPRTVQSHVAHILSKLAVANRREAAAEAERLGLV